MEKRDKGSITVETTLTLTAFVFLIATMYTILNIALAQARIGYAIHQTAKELSQYSYLYSLTGFKDSQAQLHQAGVQNTASAQTVVNSLGEIYQALGNLGGVAGNAPSISSGEDVGKAWEGVRQNLGAAGSAASAMQGALKSIADNPTSVIWGMAQLAGSKIGNGITSFLAQSLIHPLIKKNLKDSRNGSVESYLAFVGVVPQGGSYYGGLDFGDSYLFPDGSDDICVDVRYKLRVLPLLPIRIELAFHQQALTRGWLAGGAKRPEMARTDSLWVNALPQERGRTIRKTILEEYKKKGYNAVSGLTDVQLYSETDNTYLSVISMNPLYSEENAPVKKVEDLSEQEIMDNITNQCKKMLASTQGNQARTKIPDGKGGSVIKTHEMKDVKRKIILVIPQDEGLDTKMQEILNKASTHGVTVELRPGFGNGASYQEKK